VVPSALPAGVDLAISDGAGDLDGILALQRANLEAHLGPEAAARGGFVTVVHTRAILEAMHAQAPSIVARERGAVVGYALAMALECRPLVPVLETMFGLMERLRHQDRPLLSYRCYVMGQVCVAGELRGSGLFDALYAMHRRTYAERYDLLVADIAVRNRRSLRAHARVGFTELHRYRDDDDDWVTVVLDLRGDPSPPPPG
jgi:hypothetical protein